MEPPAFPPAIFDPTFAGGPPHEVMPGRQPPENPHEPRDPVGWWDLIGGAWRWVTDPSR